MTQPVAGLLMRCHCLTFGLSARVGKQDRMPRHVDTAMVRGRQAAKKRDKGFPIVGRLPNKTSEIKSRERRPRIRLL